jgi:pimeloyl-ACP methyl ester carboxylesterase
MRSGRLWLSLVLIVSASRAYGRSEWQPFLLRSYDGREMQAELTMLAVRENREVRDSRLIRVAVLRLAALEGARGNPPLVFLSGGPGVPATGLARVPVYFDLFRKLRSNGDVLLIDQRGSGMSLPNLVCPAANVPADFASSDAALGEALRSRVGACTASWRSLGVDVEGYSTREIAADVDAVRRAVEASVINLVAFSYGSEVAFEILRRWPHTVARVVFASTRAPDTLLKSPEIWDRQLAAIGVLASLPIAEKVRDLVARLDSAPVRLAVNGVQATVGGIGLLTILRNDMSDGRAIPAIPALLDDIEAGRHMTLARRIEQLQTSLARSFNLMTLAVDCSSGWSPKRLARTQQEAREATMRSVNLQWNPEICNELLGRSGVPPSVTRVRTPALFITGTLDANAPVEQTEGLRGFFRYSWHVVVRNGAHETLPIPAVQRIVAMFLAGEEPDVTTVTLPSPFGKDSPAG